MKHINVGKTKKLVCAFGIAVCLLLLIPQIRQIVITLTEHLLGRELRGHAIWHGLMRRLSISILVILTGLFFLKYLKYKFNIDFAKYIIKITNSPLYSGDKEIPETEINNENKLTMTEYIKNNGWLVFSACSVFLVILVFFAVAHPVVPYDGDDWYYLSRFRHPFPDIREWNPSRIFPEVLAPLAGLFAAYIVNPILGDYLASISFTVALTIAIFATFFYWSLYRLFLSITEDKWVSILSGLIILCFYFVFFKTQEEGSQYMLRTYNLSNNFFYTIPNLLNSILVCLFMRYTIRGTHISVKGLGKRRFILIILTLYFAIFSGLYSAVIMAVYSFWQLLLTTIHKEKITKNLTLIIILAGFGVYMVLEFTGARAAWGMGLTGNYSFFSLEYLRQCKEASWNFLGLVRQINKGILFGSLLLNFFAIVLLCLKMAEDKNKPLAKIGVIGLLSFVSLIPVLVMAAGRSVSSHTGSTMYMYSIFFYYMLFSMISMVYLLTRLKIDVLILPFFLALFFLEATNTNKPYHDQTDYASSYFGNGITTQQKIDITNNVIDQVKIADKNRAESVIIFIPESSRADWPMSFELFPERLSNTLYAHGIISRRMKIILQPDRKMTDRL